MRVSTLSVLPMVGSKAWAAEKPIGKAMALPAISAAAIDRRTTIPMAKPTMNSLDARLAAQADRIVHMVEGRIEAGAGEAALPETLPDI